MLEGLASCNMKRIWVFLFVVFHSVIITGQDPDPGNKKHVLKTGFLAPVLGIVSLALEKPVSENSSLQLQLLATYEDFGIGLFLDYRFYLSDTSAPEGIFVSLFQGAGGTDDFIAGTGLAIGTQKVFKEKISVEGFVGPVVVYGPDINRATVLVRPGLTIGWVF
jgi:hypothetical protein